MEEKTKMSRERLVIHAALFLLAAAALSAGFSVGRAKADALPQSSFDQLATSSAASPVSVTITGSSPGFATLSRADAFCSAGTATLTVTKNGTTVWETKSGEVGTARFESTWPTWIQDQSGGSIVVTLSSCGTGHTGTLMVHASGT